jgi:hypothetical protein
LAETVGERFGDFIHDEKCYLVLNGLIINCCFKGEFVDSKEEKGSSEINSPVKTNDVK